MTTQTRPEFPLEALESRTDEERQYMIDEFNETCDRLEARGPLTLDFGPTQAGVLYAYDLEKMENVVLEATGEVTLPMYTELGKLELHHPSPELIESLPADVFAWCEVQGADDASFAAYVRRPEVTSLSVISVVPEKPEAPVDEDEEEEYDELSGPPGGSVLSDEAVAVLAERNDIVEVQLRSTHMTDETLERVLEANPKLAGFGIDSDVARFDRLGPLAGRDMGMVSLHGKELSPESLAALPSIPGLEAMSLHSDKLAEGEIDAIALSKAVPNLEYLRITDLSGKEIPREKTLQLRACFPDAEINDVHYAPKAVERLAKKAGVTLTRP